MAGRFDSKYGRREGDKGDGIHESDPDGGRYDLLSEEKEVLERFLIKRDTHNGQNDIAEYLAASIFQQTAPGYGAEIELAKNQSESPENPENENAFLASKFFKQGYRDFFKDNTEVFTKRTGTLAVLESTPLKSPKSAFKRKTKGAYEYNGYEQTVVTSLLLGDFSIHSGNIGVIDIEGEKGKKPKKQLVRIDFGAAFRDFTDDINPYKSIKNRSGGEKNYFLRDHPKERTMNKAFAAELRRVAEVDISGVIEKKWAEIEQNFDPKTIQAFAKQIKVPGVAEREVTSEEIKAHFTETMKKRQQSLKDMACEIDIKLALKGKKVDIAKLQEAIVSNPEHVKHILDNSKNTELHTQLRISLKENQLEILQKQYETSIHLDIERTKSYFDKTLELMKEKNLEQIKKAEEAGQQPPALIDFSQYKVLQEKWHQVCDEAAQNLSNEFSIDPVYRKKTLDAIAAMRTEIDEFRLLQKPEAYKQGLLTNISTLGQNLVDATSEIARAAKSPIDYNKFDLTTAADSGGVTGSKRVKMDDKNYQLKPSIKDNALKRRIKANWTDRENYGEVISSKIARSILITDAFEAAPNVSLVYDKVRKRTPVASKYLEGDKVRTLDKFIEEKTDIKLKDKQHIKFVDGSRKKGGANPKKREYDISGPENAALRKDIAKGIAGSIINGDHDINPGNFVVVTKDGQDRAARIDFGHAFNDLLNTSKAFGGTVRNKDNQVLDFLNRESVAGLKFGAKSKLWRDYPGMIPTQEMADAFKEVSQSTGLSEGIVAGKEEFTALLKAMERNKDEKGIAHLKKSLDAISSNISGVKLDPTLSPQGAIDAAFVNIERFAKDNQEKMASVSRLMQLQVDIDKIIEGKKKGDEPTKEQIDQIKAAYAELEKAKGIGQKEGGLEWVKTSASKAAHKGDLESYIMERGKQLGLNKELRKELARTEGVTMTPSPLFSRSGDAIALSEQSIEREVERSGKGLKESGPTILPSTTSGKTAISPVIDPVSLVREEIINKQMQILKEAVAISYPDTVSLSMEQFKDYLKNHQDIVVKSLENPAFKQDIEAQIQQTEVAGYKKFNQEFAKVAKPVAWDGPSTTSGEKTQIVKNKEGQEVCTLKEITSSQTFTAPDGSTKQVSTRSIEFPPSLKEGSGPMHASFALKNAKGDNMPAKDAVYFTAHYDKTGKLMEVTSPQPVKFMGKEDNAIGYIERNGEIYTLPVTKKTYNEMMTEVAKNKGVGINLTVKEQISSGAELVSARVKPEPEVIPQVPLVEAMSKVQISETSTKEDAMARIDKILKNRKPEEVVAFLKDQVKKGRPNVVGLIVEATASQRPDTDPPRGVAKLTPAQYKEVYDYSMHKLAPKAKNRLEQDNIHKAGNFLRGAAEVEPKYHVNLIGFNVRSVKNQGLRH
ncbi:MAG: hypothetical protein H6911_03175 [Rickettsiaceae bacterium]|nr:hypothetical protein [Rickettsiaceae bacterium]